MAGFGGAAATAVATSASARVAMTFAWWRASRARIATTCSGVFPGQNTASAAPVRTAR